jgi:energy-coupling factor transport system ATP-binding protein
LILPAPIDIAAGAAVGLGGGANGPPAVEASGLCWTYAGRSAAALKSLTFKLDPGHVLLVLGPSGSGKSTLARALAGLVPHTLPGEWRGSLRVGALEIADTPARFVGERVGLVFQDPDSQLVMARVDDEVAFGLENRGWPRAEMQTRVPQALTQVGLGGFELRGTNTLSGGEKQRLAIADVVVAKPSLLVFDEPTANLDPPGMLDTIRQIGRLARRREHTIVLIEHRLEAALPLANDVLLLDRDGRQLWFGPAGAIGPDAVSLLAESGAWVPRAWQGTEPVAFARPGRDAGRGTGRLVLRASGLGVDYPADETGHHQALDRVSLEAHAGDRIAVVGPNGAGKSTLLFVLSGIRRPDRGAVAVAATAGSDDSAADLSDPSRLRTHEVPDRVGLVFQDPELGFVARTTRDEVIATELAGRAKGGARRGGDSANETGPRGAERRQPADSEAVLARFGLAHLANQDPFRLSQGEQRRLSLAALVLRPPAVLLLDEPTFGLDRRGTEAVLDLLDELSVRGQVQLLATHDPRLLPFCDRVVALDRGVIVFDGPPREFLARPPYTPAEPWRGDAAAATARR